MPNQDNPTRSGAPWPRITVVTPSYNQGEYLDQTIRSVLDQGYPNLEYMVIDGGSTDASCEIIEEFADRIDYWVSEPDRGQAHAIRKGLDRATGALFNWINSDDLLAPGALYAVAAAMSDDTDLVAGNVENFGQGHKSKLFRTWNLTVESLLGQLVDRKVGGWHQPGCWLRTDALRQCGGIDEAFHYRFDFEMLLRYLTRFPRVRCLDRTLAYFRLHEASKTVSEQTRFAEEDGEILARLADAEWMTQHRDLLAGILPRWEWHRELEALLADSGRSRVARAVELMRASGRAPGRRFDPTTRKCLRRLLTRGRPK